MASRNVCASNVSRKRSESASLSSWASQSNDLSDVEGTESSSLRKKIKRSSMVKAADLDSLKSYSSSDDETQPSRSRSHSKRPKCLSRNAVMARQNRLKKKKYMEEMENEIGTLRRENGKLKIALEGYSKDFQVVRKENLYLRNVLANSKEISQLIRAVNATTGLPTSSSLTRGCTTSRSGEPQQSSSLLTRGSNDSVTSKSFPTSSSVGEGEGPKVRNVRRDFPIAFDDVPLTSAIEDDDELNVLNSCRISQLDLDLNDTLIDDITDLGFGPNVLGDWLDGDEALADIGVCLHVARKKVSLEFCSSCNENAFSSLDEGISV